MDQVDHIPPHWSTAIFRGRWFLFFPIDKIKKVWRKKDFILPKLFGAYAQGIGTLGKI